MKHLVIGPGAMAYFLFMGTLSALSDKGALNDLETISGASAGGLIAFMYILTKGDVSRMFELSVDIPLKKVMKPNIKALLKTYGLVSSKKISAVMVDLTRQVLQKDDVTFAELWAHWPVKLYISACCIDLGTTHYFSVDTHPDMSVHEALTMTVAVPFLIQSVKKAEWHYIDGGALEETPCGRILDQDPRTVHVIRMGGEFTARVNNLKTYGLRLLGTAFSLRHTYRTFQTTVVDVDDLDIFDFSMSIDSKVKMFVAGYTSCTICPRAEIDPPHMLAESPPPNPEHPASTCDAEPPQ